MLHQRRRYHAADSGTELTGQFHRHPDDQQNGQNIRDALAATPMDQFMLETDSPFQVPVPCRGKRCEPAYVKEISEVAARVKGCSLEELSTATCATAERFFGKLLPP